MRTKSRKQHQSSAWRHGRDGQPRGQDREGGRRYRWEKFATWEASDLERQAIQRAIDGFEESHPNVSVEYTVNSFSEHHAKLNTQINAGDAPDVFWVNPEYMRDFVNRDQLMDVTGLMDEMGVDVTDYLPSSLEKMQYVDENGDSHIYGVDCCIVGPVIFYNKDLFDQAGITEEPKTWEELLEVCQTLKDAGIQPIMDNCQDAAVNFTAPLYGSEVKSKNPNIVQDIFDGKATFKDTWTTPIAMWKEGLIDNGYLTADMVGATSDEIVTAFATGQVAMILSGSWNLNTIDTINPDMNYKCMGVPGTEETYYCGAVNVGLCINSASQNKELAKAFLEFAASPEGLEAQYKGYGGFTIANGYSPEFPEEIAEAVTQVKDGKYYIPMADWLSYTESLRLTYIQSLQDCMVGTITPEEAASKLDAKLAEVSAE